MAKFQESFEALGTIGWLLVITHSVKVSRSTFPLATPMPIRYTSQSMSITYPFISNS